jgi:hypothetical protein
MNTAGQPWGRYKFPGKSQYSPLGEAFRRLANDKCLAKVKRNSRQPIGEPQRLGKENEGFLYSLKNYEKHI